MTKLNLLNYFGLIDNGWKFIKMNKIATVKVEYDKRNVNRDECIYYNFEDRLV